MHVITLLRCAVQINRSHDTDSGRVQAWAVNIRGIQSLYATS